jgi:hypothetical protein
MKNRLNLEQSRLGKLLINSNLISENHLEQALEYQQRRQIKLGTALVELNLITRKQLTRALRRQNWTRGLAAAVAIACTPVSTAFANDHSPSQTIVQKNTLEADHAKLSSRHYNNDLYFSPRELDEASRNFYYSSDQKDPISINTDFSKSSGLKLSFIRSSNMSFNSEVDYRYDPQISLFKYSSSRKTSNFSDPSLGKGMNRYKNSKPAVFMLTLKGRCLLENSGDETTMWSLNRAKKGVQRKAELMFSITKQF